MVGLFLSGKPSTVMDKGKSPIEKILVVENATVDLYIAPNGRILYLGTFIYSVGSQYSGRITLPPELSTLTLTGQHKKIVLTNVRITKFMIDFVESDSLVGAVFYCDAAIESPIKRKNK